MIHTSGVAIGALVYVLAASCIFYSFMITNPVFLLLTCILIQTVAGLTVYCTHLVYQQEKDKIDLLAVASAIIIGGMSIVAGMKGQVIILTAVYLLAGLLSLLCVTVPKGQYLSIVLVCYSIAMSLSGFFCLLILSRPADTLLVINNSDYNNYDRFDIGDLFVLFILLGAIDLVSVLYIRRRVEFFKAS